MKRTFTINSLVGVFQFLLLPGQLLFSLLGPLGQLLGPFLRAELVVIVRGSEG